MNLAEWMLNNLPPEVIEDNVNRKLAELINSRLAIAWDEGAFAPRMVDGSELPAVDNPYRREGA